MATVTHTITARLHGSGIAACGSYPEITCTLTIDFTRADGDQMVYWEVTDISWTHPTSGRYGYQFYATIDVDDDVNNAILTKSTLTPVNWWNSMTVSAPSGRFLASYDTTYVKFFVEGRHCMDSGHYCYDIDGRYLVDVFKLTIPTYETSYTVSYDANGGKGAPQSQTKSSLQALTLSSQIPAYPITISYHNGAGGAISDSYTYNRTFNNWLGNGTTYAPGGQYTANANCTMVAQWGSAQFTPIAIPESYYTVTFNAGGGSVSPTYKQYSRSKSGYATSSSGSAQYQPGSGYSTQTSLDLYPIYGNATLVYSTLPTPMRSGYQFNGWYYNGSKITGNITITSNITITAQWTALPIHKFQNNSWGSDGPYVWKFVNGSWQKVAHIRKFENDQWVDISGG